MQPTPNHSPLNFGASPSLTPSSPFLFGMTPCKNEINATSFPLSFSPCPLPQVQSSAGLRVLHAGASFPRELIQKIDAILKNWKDAREGIIETESGTSHSLLIQHTGKPIALFKPENRELGTQWDKIISQNRHIASKLGIAPGEGAFREYLAFLYIRQVLALSTVSPNQIDVAETAYVRCASEGLYTEYKNESPFSVVEQGSLHVFEPGCTTYKNTPDLFKSIPPHLAHLLAILDVVLMNSDRNSGNLLIQKNEDGSSRLLLIDHSAILPSKGESSGKFIWLDWPQLQEPMSPETIAFVEELTPETLIDILGTLQRADLNHAHNFNPNSLWVHGLVIELLQQGIRKRLSLYEIASLLTRLERSRNEKDNAIAFLFKKICQRGNSEIKVAVLLEEVNALLDNYKKKLDELKPSDPETCPKTLCLQAKEFCLTNPNTPN